MAVAEIANSPGLPVLVLSDVKLSFGGVRALNGVSFGLDSGQWCGLIGPNGSGKTSTLNVLTGFYKAQSGTVRYKEKELFGRRTRSGGSIDIIRTFQHPVLSGRLSILDNVLLGIKSERGGSKSSRRAGRADAVEAAVDILEQLDCKEHIHQCATEAPYGVRKRAEIARALLRRPTVLLLDEPAAGLSDEERIEVIGALRKLRGKDTTMATIVVEHDVRFVSQLCERSVALDFGSVVASGLTADVLANPKVRAAFLGEG